jgi:hypothetical protein
MEIWKNIPEFNGDYQASTFGNIKNKSGKILKQRINKHRGNYMLIRFYGKPPFYKVHRLIAKTFIPNLYNKPDINHIDGNKTNNRIENLEWCTRSENMTHAYNTGLAGGKSYNSKKLNNEDVKNIKKLLENGSLIKEISNIYNISQSYVSAIKNNKRKKYFDL